MGYRLPEGTCGSSGGSAGGSVSPIITDSPLTTGISEEGGLAAPVLSALCPVPLSPSVLSVSVSGAVLSASFSVSAVVSVLYGGAVSVCASVLSVFKDGTVSGAVSLSDFAHEKSRSAASSAQRSGERRNVIEFVLFITVLPFALRDLFCFFILPYGGGNVNTGKNIGKNRGGD